MAWFKVDDKFHSHSKVRKVITDDPAALALWVVAGSWSSDNGTDGFVPDHQLPWLIPAGASDLAQKLITARLWRRVRGGYQMHDFADWNPTAEKVLAKREARAEAGRKGGLASGKTRSKVEANASANAEANAEQKRTPTRPDPTHMGGSSYSPTYDRAREPLEPRPEPTCREHQDDPDPPACRRCKTAREKTAAWDVAHAQSEAERQRTQPKCERHPGQPAHHCGLCRSERIGAE